ncbi:MAG TPA: hypothetical protein VM183_09710 [Burkholderiales bacterium]|nr:hypothetical protein [Burkholderiales bacterium]
MHKWRFVESMVADAPDHKGVYVLWSDGFPLGVGHALGGSDTIRSRLLSHLSHATASGMRNVTHYSWQLSPEPRKRALELEGELGLTAVEMPPQELEAGPRRSSNADSGQTQEG